MRIRKKAVTFVASVLVAVMFAVVTPGTALADTGAVTANEVVAALDAVADRNDNLVVDPAASVSDSRSAARTDSVEIPVDPTQGVKFKGKSGKSLIVKLPNVRKGDKGKKARNGTVVYGSKGDSLNAVIPGADGSAQAWTYIRNRKAAESYRYCVDGVARFGVLDNGGAIGYDRSDQPVTLVMPPTATQKNTGKVVPTSYKAEANCLVQHVAHRAKGVQYPVVADPWWIPVSATAVVAAFTAGAYACGLGYLVGAAWQIFWNGWVWNEVRRAGREGCVEGVVARFMPVAWFRALIKR